MLTDERYKQLMANAGMPNSVGLLQTLQQAVMEATLIEREACANTCDGKLKELYLSDGRSAQEEAFLVAAADDCASAIRSR